MSTKWGIYAIAVVAIGLSILVGCEEAGAGADDGDGDLPVKTIIWESDGEGFQQFYTNDEQEYDYGFLSTGKIGPSETSPQVFDVIVKKESGNRSLPYGMLFDYAEYDYHLRVLISLSGFYRISRRYRDPNDDSRVLAEILSGPDGDKGWVYADGVINTNAGGENRLVATVDRATDTLTVSINGTEVLSGVDYVDHGGAGRGGYASVGDETEEDFPNTPVDVRYKLP